MATYVLQKILNKVTHHMRTSEPPPYAFVGRQLEANLRSIIAFSTIEGMNKAAKIIIQVSYHYLNRARFIQQNKRVEAWLLNNQPRDFPDPIPWPTTLMRFWLTDIIHGLRFDESKRLAEAGRILDAKVFKQHYDRYTFFNNRIEQQWK